MRGEYFIKIYESSFYVEVVVKEMSFSPRKFSSICRDIA